MGNLWSCMKEAMYAICGEEETNEVSSAPERAIEPPTVRVVEADLQTKQNLVESSVSSTSEPRKAAPERAIEPPTVVGVVEADLQTKQNLVESSVASTSEPRKAAPDRAIKPPTVVGVVEAQNLVESSVASTSEPRKAAPERAIEPPTVVGVVEADLQTKQNLVESSLASTSEPRKAAPKKAIKPPTVVGLVEADLQTKQNLVESSVASTSEPRKAASERAIEPPTVVGVVEVDLQTKQNLVESSIASTSEPRKVKKYAGEEDVFLSHSGMQKNFVRQLYRDLTSERVSCFFDESRESLPLAEKWAPRIFEAAETCRVAVLLLSMDFIRSRWPMLELSAFVQAKKSGNSNLKILPLFFKISPRDIKDLTSDTQDILDWTRLEISEETRIKWKEALTEVRKINGLQFKEGENEVSFRDEIIKEIRNLLPLSVKSVRLAKGQEKVTLPRAQPLYPERAVGLEEPVKKITKMLELERLKEGGEVMVIYGFGGIGKTTLANAVVANLNPKAKDFNYAKINIAEDPQKNDLKSMQEQLLEDAFPKYEGGTQIKLRDCEDGRHHLTQAFQSEPNEPVFIFIDNALRAQDLEELLPEDLESLSQGSRILVTARDLSVTDLFEERGLPRRSYRVEPLADEHAKKILCNDPVKLQQIKDDENKILQICSGIPLVLKIVGAQLRKNKYRADNCNDILTALQRGKKIKKEDLSKRLFYFVYDSLEISAQEAFLDICSVLYMKDFSRRAIEHILGENEVATLEEAALITAVPFANTKEAIFWNDEKLIVHDVILANGRSMAKDTRIEDDPQSLFGAVKDQVVLQSIKGVWFNYDDKSTYRLEESQLSSMSNLLRVFSLGRRMSVTGCSSNTFQELRYLAIGGAVPCLPVNLEALPRLAYYVGPIFKEGFKLRKSLRYLRPVRQFNQGECSTSEESNPIQTDKNSSLQELDLSGVRNMAILLEGIHQFIDLKILSVRGWYEMEELPPQVCQLRSLNKLNMCLWRSLKRLPDSFSNLTCLTHLHLEGCSQLEGLCSSFGELRDLRYLSLKRCEMLTGLPYSFGQLIALECLDMERCSKLTILPDNFGQLTALKYLDLFSCFRLKELPVNLGELRFLQELDLRDCDELKELPPSLEDLTSLKILR